MTTEYFIFFLVSLPAAGKSSWPVPRVGQRFLPGNRAAPGALKASTRRSARLAGKKQKSLLERRPRRRSNRQEFEIN
jgi:hypothetical protein